MSQTVNKAIELVRVIRKSKSPVWNKSMVRLMSDGSAWGRDVHKSPSGKRIKGKWNKFQQTFAPVPSVDQFINIFISGGWKRV